MKGVDYSCKSKKGGPPINHIFSNSRTAGGAFDSPVMFNMINFKISVLLFTRVTFSIKLIITWAQNQTEPRNLSAGATDPSK